ncbi:hypothetical protein EIN_216600 [Entamoeba invadens IP1]|uniref:ADP-ribosylation factor n=1 Tax=Entamoeba invadens IP1 TaxID=370355 RepID=A0A0A1UFR4_ENTIV|nr:hypothetical protein EIN_216600 [Entamoeba invadens IP1]ELP92895.1 hypothetical protein EIN_216600 [Entamoeba invadens IP1]|eukprot:XP_004259666.1 hypothetical protein EIN_216600 [Entamoeba invadens IP1]
MGNYLYSPSPAVHLFITGLDAAGKTTIIYKFCQMKNIQFEVKNQYNSFMCFEHINFKNYETITLDLGGNMRPEPFITKNVVGCNVLMYVIDISDVYRRQEAKDEMFRFLQVSETRGIPLIIIFSKVDLPYNMTETEFIKFFELDKIKERKWTFIMMSAYTEMGLLEGFKWVESKAKLIF